MLKENEDSLFDRLVWLAVAGAVASLSGALGHYNFFFDLISNFRIQYIVGSIVVLLLALFRGQFVAVLVLIVVLVVHGYGVWPYLAGRPVVTTAPDFRVVTCNLLASNREHDNTIRYIEQLQADIIVFQEYSNQWDEALRRTLAPYQYRVVEQLNSPFSIAMFSRHPMQSSEVVAYSGSAVPSVEATVSIDDQSVKVIGTHPWPPEREWSFRDRNMQLQAIGEVAGAHSGPVLVMGDLNIAPWSAHFDALLRVGGLRDAKEGFGLMPTWPAGYFPLMIIIDHILVNDDIAVKNMQASDNLGSDHLCLSADLVLLSDV